MSFIPLRAPARIAPLALALLVAVGGHAHAQSSSPSVEEIAQRLKAIERQLGVEPVPEDVAADPDASLDQRLRVIERRLELLAEEAAAKAEKDQVATLSTAKGFSIKSPDGVELKLRGLVQADGRFFVGDDHNPQNDGFLFRRIRPTLEGSWGSLVGFRLTPEFAGDTASIVDAYIDLKFDPRATVRIGKVKGPVGLERLQSGGSLALVERGFPTELAPNRDLGVQLQGDVFANRLNYTVGVYNGAPDGRDAATTNPDNEFEYAARVFWEPFKNDANAFSGLGIGIAASVGDTFGAGNNFLPRYRSPGQSQFFAYNTNVAADGLRRRLSPQGYFYRGRFGVLAEYITAEQDVRVASGANAGRRKHIENDAYQITANVVLTGEDAGFRGVTRPNHPFTIDGAGWGAWELVARYGELDIDDAAFPLFANAAQSARSAESWSLGVNWYLTQNLKLVATYNTTTFDGGATGGADRETEKAILTRAQLSF
jgi:phosphate-selective porin OprO and OprP